MDLYNSSTTNIKQNQLSVCTTVKEERLIKERKSEKRGNLAKKVETRNQKLREGIGMRDVTASGLAAGAAAGCAADGLVDAVEPGPPWRRPPGLILLLGHRRHSHRCPHGTTART